MAKLKSKRSIITFTFLFLSACSFSQNSKIDSLQIALRIAHTDSAKIMLLNMLSREIQTTSDYARGLTYAIKAKKLSEKLLHNAPVNKAKLFKQLLSNAENNIGIIAYNQGNYANAIAAHTSALKLRKEIDSKVEVAGSYCNISNVYQRQGNYPRALEYLFNALAILEKTPSANDYRANVLMNIGNAYLSQNETHEALQFYKQCLKLMREVNDKKGQSDCLGNMGNTYEVKEEYDEALDLYLESLKITQEINYKSGTAFNLNDIGSIYEKQGQNEKALSNYMQALHTYEEIGDKYSMVGALNKIGSFYMRQKNNKTALQFFLKSLALAQETGSMDYLKNVHKNLSEVYERLHLCTKELFHYKAFIEIKDSLYNEKNTKRSLQTQLNYEFEKKEQEAHLKQEKKDAIAKEENEKRNAILYGFTVGFILVLILIAVILKSYRQNKKSNKLLEMKTIFIEEQSRIVESKNKDITDSINYAKRIQDAVLPPNEFMNCLFKDAFVFYKPRDIVSGDFYWLAEKNNRRFIATVDCTGHGIPGAFMSMIGNTLLNGIILEKDIHHAGEILSLLREGVIKLLKQTETEGGNKDGMDISLCIIENNTVQFAGANNPLWLIRSSAKGRMTEFVEFKADKQPIGIYSGEVKPFRSHTFNVHQGDSLYMFTDGYADQFGGPKGKKFKYTSLQKLLVSIQQHSMQEQKQILKTSIEDWQGLLDQIDDILLIGVRF